MKKGPVRFVVKLLSLLLASFAVLAIINTVYVNGVYYKDVYGEVKKFENIPYGIKYTNLGTSHGLASFKYGDDTDKFNLALSGSDIYHNLQVLKQYSDHLEEGAVVAIPVSYFQFCMSTETPTEKRYYTVLDKDKIRSFSYEILICTKYFPVLKSGEYLFKDLINDQNIDVGGDIVGCVSRKLIADVNTSAVNYVVNVLDMGVGEENITNTEDTVNTSEGYTEEEYAKMEASLESHGKGRAESWRSGYMVTGEKYMEENRNLLIETINYCYDNGFKPVLVTTPIYHTLNEAFSEEELQTCYWSNIDIVTEETGVPYLDLSHSEVFAHTPEYFGNSDHLNGDGGQKCTEVYYDFLRELGYME